MAEQSLPQTPVPLEERRGEFFQPEIVIRALARRVLAVARTRVEGTWAAYIDAVPGNTHSAEFQAVLETGCKLIEPIARALFPKFKKVPYAH